MTFFCAIDVRTLTMQFRTADKQNHEEVAYLKNMTAYESRSHPEVCSLC